MKITVTMLIIAYFIVHCIQIPTFIIENYNTFNDWAKLNISNQFPNVIYVALTYISCSERPESLSCHVIEQESVHNHVIVYLKKTEDFCLTFTTTVSADCFTSTILCLGSRPMSRKVSSYRLTIQQNIVIKILHTTEE